MRGLRYRCFQNFAKVLRKPFLWKSSGRLLLNIYSPKIQCFVYLTLQLFGGIWGFVSIENKVNLTFHCQVKSQARVLNTDLEKTGVRELIFKVITSPVFFVAYTNKHKQKKHLQSIVRAMILTVCRFVCQVIAVWKTESNYMNEEKQIKSCI